METQKGISKEKAVLLVLVIGFLCAQVAAYTLNVARPIPGSRSLNTTTSTIPPNYVRTARNYSVVVRPTTTTTSTLRYSSVSLSPGQIREWNNRHSSLQSWGAQGGFDECKRVTRKIFGLPGPSDVTYLPGGGFSVQCFQDKGGYLDVSGDVFQFQTYDERSASFVTLNVSRLRIVPRNRTRFLAGGIW